MIDMLYDKFKHWSNEGSVYIISDTHFGDADCKFMDPDWISPQDHIKIINKTVNKNDTLICLGDCGDLEWFNKIRAGYKILIKGNHDDKGKNYYQKTTLKIQCEDEDIEELKKRNFQVTIVYPLRTEVTNLKQIVATKGYFDEVYDGPLFIAPKILLSHEPIEGLDWCINIHGHDHSKWTGIGINLAANVYNYQVFNLGKEIKKGLVSKINDIHRTTINKAIERKG